MQRALNDLRSDEKLVELGLLLAFLARFVLDSELVSQIMRWDMVVLRESPWYQEILNEGEVKGRREGRQEGRREEGVSLVLRQLTRRVGPVSDDIQTQVQSLSMVQVEALGEALLDSTDMAGLEEWLQSPPSG